MNLFREISLVEFQKIDSKFGEIKYLFQGNDQLHFIESLRAEDSFGSFEIVFRSYKVGDSKARGN